MSGKHQVDASLPRPFNIVRGVAEQDFESLGRDRFEFRRVSHPGALVATNEQAGSFTANFTDLTLAINPAQITQRRSHNAIVQMPVMIAENGKLPQWSIQFGTTQWIRRPLSC